MLVDHLTKLLSTTWNSCLQTDQQQVTIIVFTTNAQLWVPFFSHLLQDSASVEFDNTASVTVISIAVSLPRASRATCFEWRVNKSGFNFWANPRQERRRREHDTDTFGTNNNTKNKTADSSTCCTRMTVIIKSFHNSIMRVVNWSQHQKINCSSFHHSIIRLVTYLSHPTLQHKTICSYSHSTVAGGLDVMSWQTRFMPRTLLQILFTTSTRNAWSK